MKKQKGLSQTQQMANLLRDYGHIFPEEEIWWECGYKMGFFHGAMTMAAVISVISIVLFLK